MIDNFEDGDFKDGSPVSWSTEGVGAFDAAAGDLVISSPGGLAYFYLTDPASETVDTSVRAQVRFSHGGFPRADFWVWGHNQGVLAALGRDGKVYLQDRTGGAINGPKVATDLRPAEEDVILQLDFFDGEARVYAWRPGEGFPSAPRATMSLSIDHATDPGAGFNPREFEDSVTLRYLMYDSEPIRVPESLTQAEVVEIPNPKLREAILQQLGKLGGDITVADLASLTELNLSFSQLTSLILPEGLTSLTKLSITGNDNLTSLTLPQGLTSLTTLDLSGNQLTSLTLPEDLTSLTTLSLFENELTSLTLPEDLTSLTMLDLGYNRGLTSLILPEGLTCLGALYLGGNELTSLTLPEGLTCLTTLFLSGNLHPSGNPELTDFSFLKGLSSLTTLRLFGDQLTSLTLPEGLTSLSYLDLSSNLSPNPLTNLILPEALRGHVSDGSLKVSGFPREQIAYYDDRLLQLTTTALPETRELAITLEGPAGTFVFESSVDLRIWSADEKIEKGLESQQMIVPVDGGNRYFRVVKME